MSNDTYSGSSLNNLRPTTPEDADGFNVDARALRQIKRFLKNSDGLIQTITDILTKENSTILDKIKGSQRYSRPNAVIALRADVNPNDSDKYTGRWEKLNGVSICGTGNAGFYTFPFVDSDSAGKFGPNYKLSWVLTASQYSNCTLDPIIEKHSDRTYRLMLRLHCKPNVTAALNKIYFYTLVGNLNDLEAVSFSIKNAWSLYSDCYMSNWPYLALSKELFKKKYPNYRIKVTLSKSPTYDPAGVVIGEATIEDYLKNGIYFNDIENTIKDIAGGYIVISIISPTSVEFTEDTTWWLVDAEVTVNLKRSYEAENYSTYNVELNKDYTSSLPLQGINFWKRIDDGTERDSNTD